MNLNLTLNEAVFLSYAARVNRKHLTEEEVDRVIEENDSEDGTLDIDAPDAEIDEMRTWIAMHRPRFNEQSSVASLIGKLAKEVPSA